MSRPFIRLSAISKHYPGVTALDRVDLQIAAGEIVGLIGENGAGKSTLMKVLGGGVSPDSGTIEIDGEPVVGLNPARATALGIAFVHQELNPFTNLDVAANVLLGREITTGPWRRLDRAAMARKVRPILEALRAPFAPDDPVSGLSLAEQQLLEIARALSIEARLVIMDEPTSSLTLAETRRLLEIVRELASRGTAVLFISHRLSEVEAIADRVVVLRDGRNAGELRRGEMNREAMITRMIGRDLQRLRPRDRDTAPQVETASVAALAIRDMATRAFPHARAGLELRKGEILGLAGLIGSGRTELSRVIFGIEPAVHGEALLDGRPFRPTSVRQAIAAGLCLVPEDRKGQGLHLDFSITENIALPGLSRLSHRGVLSSIRMSALAEFSIRELAIRAAGQASAAVELSGGNQQKIVLAKWLAMNPRVLIIDEPTRGIDVGARAEVYRVLRVLTRRGVGVLMISSDMEEVIGVSDRVAVMREGNIAGVLESGQFTEQRILDLAIG